MRDLLIYVQVPFCPSKCHFCGWVSDIPVRDLRQREGDSPRVGYLRALQEQIRHHAPRLVEQDYHPQIMYFGGGTASALSVEEFTAVIDTLRSEFDLGQLEETTIESSPDTLSPEKMQAYREAGFNRISIGVQSFDDARLAKEGRSHRAEQAREAVWMARDAGFEEINVDLMCGLPEETLEEFHLSARALIGLPITHISLYPYAPVVGTVMYRQLARGQVHLDRKERHLAYALGKRVFEKAGFPEYAMSYFGRRPCRADMAYYRMEMDYIGLGSGASSLLNGESLTTHKPLIQYTAHPTEFAERTPAASKSAHFLLYQSLALFEGVDAARWEERIGVSLGEVLTQEPIAQWIETLKTNADLIEDERGVRLPREKIARTFIEFLGFHVPSVQEV